MFGSSIRWLRHQGGRQIDIVAEEVACGGPAWSWPITSGVLGQECNAFFNGRAG